MSQPKSKLYDKLDRLISEKYYVLPRGPFIPPEAGLHNVGALTRDQLVSELEEFMRKRLR